MGRGGKWSGNEERYSSGPTWHVWQGARSPKTGAHPWKKGNGKAAEDVPSRPVFPTFDASIPARAGPSRHAEPDPSADAGERLVPSVQRALNGTRKAETRLSKLMKDKAKAEKQWEIYVKEAQIAYVREKERFLKAVEHYDKEILDAKEAQRLSRAHLRQAAISEGVLESDAMEAEQAEASAEWSRMVEEWEQERATQDDALLRRAFLERADMTDARTPSAHRAAPRSPAPAFSAIPPPSRAPPASTEYRPMYNAGSPGMPSARYDPYNASSPPGLAPPPTDEMGHWPEATTPEQPVPKDRNAAPVHPGQKRHPTDPRLSVKAATKSAPERPAVHADFATRLGAKRSAMQPFGGAPGLAAPVLESGTPVPLNAKIVDDDQDQEMEEDLDDRPGPTEPPGDA